MGNKVAGPVGIAISPGRSILKETVKGKNGDDARWDRDVSRGKQAAEALESQQQRNLLGERISSGEEEAGVVPVLG